jgi:GTP-binding protein YchF
VGLQLGIVGLPNAGKSTLFNALTRAGALVAPYPFTTVDPNVGVATLSDSRLTALAEMVKPERVIPATVEFVDIAGLVRGAHRGEGLGNQFLGHIRNVDAVIFVTRCFSDPNIPHPYGQIDPLADLETVNLELALADLATVERRLEKSRSAAKAAPAEYAVEVSALESLQGALQAGKLAVEWGREHDRLDWVQALQLLTAKPRLYVANVSEADLPSGGPLATRVQVHATAEGGESVSICAQTEYELLDWSDEEAALYLEEMGISGRGLARLVDASFRLLDLITFYTITGGKEARAWPIPRNTAAPVAAGQIHTDMERGFIRAEAIAVDDLLDAGSWSAARSTGRLRIEGRNYLVQGGDVIHFRFAV